MKFTNAEMNALQRGLARIYRGRIVPIQQGGATFTPKTIIAPKTMGNGSGNITTWQYNNTGTGESVARSLSFSGQAGGTGAISVEMGVTGATATANQRFIDAAVLTANLPYFVNGWYTIPGSSFLSGFSDNTATTGYAAGVLSS